MQTPDGLRVTTFVLAVLAAHTGIVAAPARGQEAKESQPPESKTTVEWYGHVKLDAAWDESLVDGGNFARWVISPSLVGDHSRFDMTARETRLGFELERAGEKTPPIGARLEIDFYGGGAENKNRPQLRHAYLEIPWPRRGLTLLAGQTSDVISPLVPSTLNYTVAWWAGNIGYRRPMARLTRTIESDSGSVTRLTAAISRTVGDDFGSTQPGDSGSDSGVPTLQLAASRSFPLAAGAGRDAVVGISAHRGEERLEKTLAQPVTELDSWSVNLDLQIPLGDRTMLKGELWTGENLDDYLGGIGQGIDSGRNREVEATGGWLAIDTRAGARTAISLGLGIDDPDDETLPAGGRTRNESIWANFQWDFRSDLRFGVEGSWWRTGYLGLEEGSSLRLQTSLIFRFAGKA